MSRTAKKQIRVLDEGIEIDDDIDSLNFTGAGITGTAIGGDVTENVPGGGGSGLNIETPTGSVDSVNVVFTVSSVPVYIVSDGAIYFEGVGYTRVGLTITLTVPPQSFIRSFY